jgi:hypothetical protein
MRHQLREFLLVRGVAVFAVGVYLHFSAPLRSLSWMLFVLLVAFAAGPPVMPCSARRSAGSLVPPR